MDSQSSPFESNVIRLLSLERGHPSHTSSQEPVELNFTLTEEEAAQVARWNSREKIRRCVVQLPVLLLLTRCSLPGASATSRPLCAYRSFHTPSSSARKHSSASRMRNKANSTSWASGARDLGHKTGPCMSSSTSPATTARPVASTSRRRSHS